MKRLLLLAATLSALWSGACSGGGSQPPPPPPKGPFSNASLSGQYAFSMAGSEIASSGLVVSNPFTRIGTFTADSKGAITAGVEDIHLVTRINRIQFTGGSYTVNADGRGTLSLINSTGTLQFSITLASSSNGFMVAMPTDGLSTASGNFIKQDTTAFSLGGIANNYAFDLSGSDPNGNPESFIGQFHSDGAGSIPTGLSDDNDGGVLTAPTTPTPIAGATYAADALNAGDLGNFGRGVFSINGVVGVFYIVDHTRVFLMETTSGGTLNGSAVLQSSVPTSVASVSGGFVFVMGGASAGGPSTRGGSLSTSGGAVSNVFLDTNNAGQVDNRTASAGTYTIDSNPTGRGTITIVGSSFTPSQQNSFIAVFYLISPTQGFLQDQSKGFVQDGTFLSAPSSAPTDSSVAGNYAFSWSGVSTTNAITDEEDFVGQLALSGGNFTGAVDFNEFASGKQFFDVVTSGSLKLSAGHSVFTANLASGTAPTLPFFAYPGLNNTILVMGTQKGNTRVIAGVLSFQNPQGP